MNWIAVDEVVPIIHLYALPAHTPLYADYYLADRDIRYTRKKHVLYRPVDVWTELADRRKWVVGILPSLSVTDVNDTRGWHITDRYPQKRYLTGRVKRFCTEEVLLYMGPCRIVRLIGKTAKCPACFSIQLEVSDKATLKQYSHLTDDRIYTVEPSKNSGVMELVLEGRPRECYNLLRLQLNDVLIKKFKMYPGTRVKIKIKMKRSTGERPPSPIQEHQKTDNQNQGTQTRPPVTEDRRIQTVKQDTRHKKTQTKTSPRTPSPELQRTPTPEIQRTPTPEIQRTPTPEIQRTPTPITPPKPPQNPDNLKENEYVLARWDDDKWYYKGHIVCHEGGDLYRVRDRTDRDESIKRKNIIRIGDTSDRKISDNEDYVLAPHPIYPWSYAPGCVVGRHGDNVTVRFYDERVKDDIKRWEVYPNSPSGKHGKDVDAIRAREKDWEGKGAIIRNDSSGFYELGTVKYQLGKDQKYQVELEDSGIQEQRSIHIYGMYTRPHKFTGGSYVLACVDRDEMKFLPGQVRKSSTDTLTVDFVNGDSLKNISVSESFWMNRRYYLEAKELFLKLHPPSLQHYSEEE